MACHGWRFIMDAMRCAREIDNANDVRCCAGMHVVWACGLLLVELGLH